MIVLHLYPFAYIFGSVLKYRTSLAVALSPFFLAFMLLLSACTKEEMVAPCQSEAEVTSKTMSVPNDGVFGDPSHGSTRDSLDVSTGEDDGISDDGDDLSDTERKKR